MINIIADYHLELHTCIIVDNCKKALVEISPRSHGQKRYHDEHVELVFGLKQNLHHKFSV